MRTLIWSNTFTKSFKRLQRKRQGLHKEVEAALRFLTEDPFFPKLETHKLKGKLSGSWACSAGYDLRIVFDFIKSEEGREDDIFLIAVGPHDEVY
jgi:addiction module RelE/StbE family toxin